MGKHPWPKLSETLTGPKSPACCQSCGAEEFGDLRKWREHDDSDKPTPVRLFLCGPCSDKLIDPHPRLYSRADRNDPDPGAMAVCAMCRHQKDLGCTHPDAKANGGPGILIHFSQATVMFVDGIRNGRRFGEQYIHRSSAPKCDALVLTERFEKEAANG